MEETNDWSANIQCLVWFNWTIWKTYFLMDFFLFVFFLFFSEALVCFSFASFSSCSCVFLWDWSCMIFFLCFLLPDGLHSRKVHKPLSKSRPHSCRKSCIKFNNINCYKRIQLTLIKVSKTPPLLELGFLKVKSGSRPSFALSSLSSIFRVLRDCLVRLTSLWNEDNQKTLWTFMITGCKVFHPFSSRVWMLWAFSSQ